MSKYIKELGKLAKIELAADFYGVDERTVKRYIKDYGEELKANGYFLSQGNDLKEFKLHFVKDINVPKFTPQLGFFDEAKTTISHPGRRTILYPKTHR